MTPGCHIDRQARCTAGRRATPGFALVVTLSLMILLTILAVGLLTLSSVSLRTSSASSNQAAARANARMALMLAIGEIQKQAGLDTRVTARADVLDETKPPVLGVWKSWEGTDHEGTGSSAGRPLCPGDYKAVKKARFLAWLVSGNPTTLTDSGAVPGTAAGTDKVALVGPGSVGQGVGRDKLQVYLTPTKISSGKTNGSFAWWVGGENQKARLPKPYKPATDSVAGWSALAKSHAVADPSAFRMDSLLDDATPADKAISLRQSDLIASAGTLAASREFFHDLSATSVGLLTNTATGGWRKDLSLLTENWAQLPKTNQPFFRVAPGKDILFNIPVRGSDYRPDKSLIYPWSGYRTGSSVGGSIAFPIYEHGAVSSWQNLRDWATLYKSMDTGGTQLAARSYNSESTDAYGNFDFLHKVRVIPVIARVQWVFSHSAALVDPAKDLYEPRLLVTPVVTMWNPYNVKLDCVPFILNLGSCLPNAFLYNVNGVQNLKWNSLTDSATYGRLATPAGVAGFFSTTTYTLNPGESVILSPEAPPVPASQTVKLSPGVRLQGGQYYTLKKDYTVDKDDGVYMTGIPGAAVIQVEGKFDSTYWDWGMGVGVGMDLIIDGSIRLAYRMIYDPLVAAKVYPPVAGLAQATLSQAAANPQPFLTTIFGARSASKTHLAAKGFVQSSPLVNYTSMGIKGQNEYSIKWLYPGAAHPVNSPFDYSFEKLAGAGDSVMPGTDAANHGFIVTGFQSADGLSRCVLAELPTKPIQSLAELQHWDLRYENPIPPYAFNLIGNSDASPLFPANAAYNAGNAPKGTEDLQNDDSYCANHVLFDDWFVSSIAPNPAGMGKPASTETLKKTYTDFVSGKAPLPNNIYHPIPADAADGQTTAGADGLFTDQVNKPGAWQTIASRIEVEGMFNVNSTSVKAWRALLGHARKQKVPYLTPSGAALSGEADHAFSRLAVAGDTEAKSIGSAGAFSACAQFAGYRQLDNATLDRLAEEIVKQVRARGPFLSLAEFVNRQLSAGDLALAGTIQSALNTLAKDPAINPYAVIESGSKAATATPPASDSTGYSFPEAAVGYNAYGLPGWTRQADVLRPIAPILTARDDTFTIRAYGDVRDASGKITARATCEAVIRRTRDYVDPADAPEITALPTAAANLLFGRRLDIISFRWLTNAEI
jgi:hypothetical protein